LFRVRPIIASLNLRRRIPKPSPTTLEDLKFLNPKEYELYSLGKFIHENKPKTYTLLEILKFESELRKRINDLIPFLYIECFGYVGGYRDGVACAAQTHSNYERVPLDFLFDDAVRDVPSPRHTIITHRFLHIL